jgi:hypothetical protein
MIFNCHNCQHPINTKTVQCFYEERLGFYYKIFFCPNCGIERYRRMPTRPQSLTDNESNQLNIFEEFNHEKQI